MRITKKTLKLINEYLAKGYEIHVGNNPKMDQTKKWSGHHLVRLAQTNNRCTGYSKRTIWAAKETSK